MKALRSCLLFALVLASSGCPKSHDKIGDAPRTEKSSSSVEGGTEVSTSGISFSLPAGWKTMDLTRQTFDESANKVFGSDPKYAAMKQQASAMAKQGLIKLLAFETATMGSGFATNCNVVIQNQPAGITLEQIADASVQQMKQLVAPGTEPKLEYVTLKVGKAAFIRSEIKSPNPAVPTYVSLAYLVMKGSKMCVITFSASGDRESQLRPVAEQSMNTFQFTE